MKALISLFIILTLAATTLAQVNSPLTLRFAVADLENRPSTPFVLEFIEQVNTLSNGSITIEPIWDAGSDTFAGFETGVVQLVLLGKADLGLAGSRAFDTVGIHNFQALQAPFLITDDALAEAVATSDIAARMLDSVSWAGIVGLTLWPEDLRHPFAIMPGQTILSPEDFSGLSVRSPPSFLTYILLETLGGSPMFGGSDYQAAESGLLQGFSLTGTPTATGNVVFFPKFQVLFATGAALEGLSEEQRAVLREAATRTQEKAIAEHPKEADAAAQWCADGGSIVMASEEQQAAFEEAARPVFEEMEQDPLNAEFIAAIRDLKASTEPAPGAEACAPEAAQQPEPTEQPEPDVPTAETGEVWSKGLPPNGVWQTEMSVEDYMAMGVSRPRANDWAGVYTRTLQDGQGLFEWRNEDNSDFARCEMTYVVVEDVVRFTLPRDCDGVVEEVKWRLDEDGLRFHLVAIRNAPHLEAKAMFEAKPWQQVEQSLEATTEAGVWSEGLPPNGVWQVELTEEDIVAQGVLQSRAPEWAGTYTWTLQDGKFIEDYQGPARITRCEADLAAVGDVVRVTYTAGPTCVGVTSEMQWRLEDDGLHLHLVSITDAPLVENKVYHESKPWQRIDQSAEAMAETEVWSEGLPPNGTWQTEVSAEDFMAMGVMRPRAREWAGIRTLTLQDGQGVFAWDEEDGESGSCEITYSVVEDFVRFLFPSGDCGPSVDDLKWRLAEDGLHFHLVAIQHTPYLENKVVYETRPWQRVD